MNPFSSYLLNNKILNCIQIFIILYIYTINYSSNYFYINTLTLFHLNVLHKFIGV